MKIVSIIVKHLFKWGEKPPTPSLGQQVVLSVSSGAILDRRKMCPQCHSTSALELKCGITQVLCLFVWFSFNSAASSPVTRSQSMYAAFGLRRITTCWDAFVCKLTGLSSTQVTPSSFLPASLLLLRSVPCSAPPPLHTHIVTATDSSDSRGYKL